MLIGTVKDYDTKKGFGYIKEENGNDLFVHYSAILGGGFKTLENGQKVTYVVAYGKKGPIAAKVSPIVIE